MDKTNVHMYLLPFGVFVNSFIMNERAPMKTNSMCMLRVGSFQMKTLMLSPNSNCPSVNKCGVNNSSLHLTFPVDKFV